MTGPDLVAEARAAAEQVEHHRMERQLAEARRHLADAKHDADDARESAAFCKPAATFCPVCIAAVPAALDAFWPLPDRLPSRFR